jgi:hypothetical protein
MDSLSSPPGYGCRSHSNTDGPTSADSLMPKELVIAPIAIIDEILQHAVRPLLIRFERSLKTSLSLRIGHGIESSITYSTIAGEGKNYRKGAVVGDANLCFRLNYGGNRYLFRFDAVFGPDASPNTGFSGFRTSGAVTVVDDCLRLDQNGHIVLYNDWKLPDRTQYW